MTQSTGRQDAMKAILGLVPPRGAEEAAARANLDRLDDAALEAMRSELAKSAEAFGRKPDPVEGASMARRAGARAKLVSGFSKLSSATRMLEEYDRAREQPRERPTSAAEIRQEVLVSPPETVARPPRSGSVRLPAEAVVAATDTWHHPLVIGAVPEARRFGETVDTVFPAAAREAPVVPVDESVLAVDLIRSLIAKQITNVLELSRVDETHVSQVREMFDAFLKDEVIDKYLHVQTTGMIRDILAMALHERLGLADAVRFAPIFRHFQSRLRSPSGSVETTFLSSAPHVLAETTAIDGFAKMVIRIREYAPDIVVVIKGGGEIAGKLVQRTYNGGARFVTLDPMAEGSLLPGKFTSDVHRVLVMDDVARTGRTMVQALDACRNTFGGTSIRGMALVGTVESAAALGDRAFFPTLSPDRTVSVPWSKEGQYHGTSKDHVLGWGKPESLSIAKSLFERAVGRLVGT